MSGGLAIKRSDSPQSCDRAAAAELTNLFANIIYAGGLSALKNHLDA
jgi:hypothetical protein